MKNFPLNTPQRWAYFLVICIVLITSYFLVLDRFAPSTDNATVQAYIINVSSYENGKVDKIFVHENQEVRKNSPLFSLDSTEYQLALEQAQAQEVVIQDQVKDNEQKVEAAAANLKTAEAEYDYQNTHHESYRMLLAQGAISQDLFKKDSALLIAQKEKVSTAEKNLAEAKQTLGSYLNGVNIHVIEAQNAIKAAQLNLSRTLILAPKAGFVTNLQIQKGSFITQGGQAITLIDNDSFWIQANLKENNLSRIKINQPVLITINAYPGIIFKGRVESIGWGIQNPAAGNGQSLPSIEKTNNWVNLAQRFPVKIKFSTPENFHLRIGSTAIVTVETNQNPIIQGLAYGTQWLRAHAQFFY